MQEGWEQDEGVASESVNQPPPLESYNLYQSDLLLQEALERADAPWAEGALQAFGARVGAKQFMAQAALAEAQPPKLRSYDRVGRRVDAIEFHPAYHACLQVGYEAGLHSLCWNVDAPGVYGVRTAKLFMLSQIEAGVCSPLSMTFAAVPALCRQDEVAETWLPRILSNHYDPRLMPATEKKGALIGMAMTEKQGGSELSGNTTQAIPIAESGPGKAYRLRGQKCFVSAPCADAFLSLAYTPAGLSCFLVPRFAPDGKANQIVIEQLKEKMGNRSNATAQIAYAGAWAQMVGEEGHGRDTIQEMIDHTRLDCSIGSAAMMRQALVQALHYTRHRKTFAKTLARHPLMSNVLCDLALESEAATTLVMAVAESFDIAAVDESRRPFARLLSSIAKYWICKRAPAMVGEALEACGGQGYLEGGPLARLYREAPLYSLWEASGNVICLDVLKNLGREPDTLPQFFDLLILAKGGDYRFDAFLEKMQAALSHTDNAEWRGRRIVQRMALALSASLLIRWAPEYVAQAFCASRLTDPGMDEVYGTLPGGMDSQAILDRAWKA